MAFRCLRIAVPATIVVAVVCCAVAHAGRARAASPQAKPNPATGMKAIGGSLGPDGDPNFATYRRLGVGIVNYALFWPAVDSVRPQDPTDPRDPAYHWQGMAGLIQAVHQAAQNHMTVTIEVRDTPAWANGGKPEVYIPLHAADFADFITAAAREFPTVHRWMIYGEPNSEEDFEPLVPAPHDATSLTPAQAAAPRHYAVLLDAAYGALKAVSRANTVIGGDTYTTGDISPRLWIRYMRLPSGKRPRLDLYGHNPFSVRAPNVSSPPSHEGQFDFSDVLRLDAWVNHELARPHQHIRLYLAEWTIPTRPDEEFNYYTSLKVQAAWITDAWRIVRAHRSDIAVLGWIHLRDDPPVTNGGLEFQSGKPKPGFFAYARG